MAAQWIYSDCILPAKLRPTTSPNLDQDRSHEFFLLHRYRESATHGESATNGSGNQTKIRASPSSAPGLTPLKYSARAQPKIDKGKTMPWARYTFFTHTDEASFSAVLQANYPNILFFEKRIWPNEYSTPVPLETINMAKTDSVYIVLPEENWSPKLEWQDSMEGYMIANLPDLSGMLVRSGGVWDGDYRSPDDDPARIEYGTLHVFSDIPPTKAEKSFVRAIWRRFDKIATWRMEAIDPETRQVRDLEKTDKLIWAGNDAIRWANDNKLRVFYSNNALYRPIREKTKEPASSI